MLRIIRRTTGQETFVKLMPESRAPESGGDRPDDPSPAASPLSPGEQELVLALAAGEEGAFAQLVYQYQKPLFRQALAYVSSEAVAEEVVQETWLAVMDGIKRFEGRSSFKTWLYQILIHKAKSAGVKESRQIPFSAMADRDDESDGMPPEAQGREAVAREAGGSWTVGVADEDTPEDQMLAEECRREITRAVRALPPAQRRVMELYHFEELTSEEVCRRLKISESNKHVLLHRGRNQVKKAVDGYFGGDRRRSNTVRQVYRLGLAA
ncbi:MAG TPA: sigma-70 family RNA polymerase sigma factor [Nitrospiraceae bacterium]|nr:sigma-70 family RNA polymerase sigma factor [Nitrospiraceae bacterium]